MTGRRWSGLRRALSRIEQTLAIGLLLVLFATLLLQVFSRFVFNMPVVWTEELARYLFAWLVFVGAAEGIRSRGHIAVDLVPLMLPLRGRLALGILVDLLLLAILIWLVKLGWDGLARSHRIPSITMDLPQSVLYACVPFGAALMSLRLAGRLWDDARGLVRGRDLRAERLAAEIAEAAR